MTKGDLRLSPKHCLNPAVPLCFFCNQPKNEVILAGHMKNDMEAPRNAVWNWEPCDKCKEYMEKGVILISVNEKLSKGDLDNPYRTGGWVVVKDEAIKRLINSELAADILKKRAAFIPDEAWDMMKLPRGDGR